MKLPMKILLGAIFTSLHLSFSVVQGGVESHALYLGTLQLKYEDQSSEAYLNLKVFSDDLQSAIRNANKSFKPGPLSELFTQNQALIEAYFKKHLQLEINDMHQVLKLYSKEQINDTFILQFKIACPKTWMNLELTADFFMELFPNQMNVVSISYQGKKQFTRLNKKKPQYKAQF